MEALSDGVFAVAVTLPVLGMPCGGISPGPADPARHCARELPAFAVPRYIEAVGELPLTETGKVRKAALRERGVTPATWDRDAAPGVRAAGSGSPGRGWSRAAGP
ncbi:hypothetical protein ACIQVK_14015 [Streptomyces sp. NPDC090493]|uniref:hypothetical protein n=1 Tax=Streptomyces sp. NPDC090493 TaxID=3365964 RepID=UPI00381E446F